MESRPEVFNYMELSSYLQDFLEYKKGINHRISLSSLAKSMGLSSRASLHHYINGKRTPSEEHLNLFKKYFNFDSKEAKHFQNIVELQEVKSLKHNSQSLLSDHLRRERKGIKLLSKKTLNVAHHWLHFAVKELLSTNKKIRSKKELESFFHFKPKGHSLEAILDDLFSLGLIEHDDNGNLVSKKSKISTEENGRDVDIQSYHTQVLELGKTALSEINPKERYFSSITFQGDREKFEKIKAFIKELEKESLVNERANRHIYHCNIQLYPVTSEKGGIH